MAREDDNPVARAAARATEGVEHRRRVQQEQVADFYARQEGLQPTPTQEENDRAKVGAMTLEELDNKEDDGSEWQDEGTARVMTAKLPGNNPYETRDIDAGGEASVPRRGGRRSKASDSDE